MLRPLYLALGDVETCAVPGEDGPRGAAAAAVAVPPGGVVDEGERPSTIGTVPVAFEVSSSFSGTGGTSFDGLIADEVDFVRLYAGARSVRGLERDRDRTSFLKPPIFSFVSVGDDIFHSRMQALKQSAARRQRETGTGDEHASFFDCDASWLHSHTVNTVKSLRDEWYCYNPR